jgi:hypothetical protein
MRLDRAGSRYFERRFPCTISSTCLALRGRISVGARWALGSLTELPAAASQDGSAGATGDIGADEHTRRVGGRDTTRLAVQGAGSAGGDRPASDRDSCLEWPGHAGPCKRGHVCDPDICFGLRLPRRLVSVGLSTSRRRLISPARQEALSTRMTATTVLSKITTSSQIDQFRTYWLSRATRLS